MEKIARTIVIVVTIICITSAIMCREYTRYKERESTIKTNITIIKELTETNIALSRLIFKYKQELEKRINNGNR